MNTRFTLSALVAAIALGILPSQAQTSSPDQITVLLNDAQSLQSRKRYLDAFTKLDEAEKIDPKRPEIYNIRGAIYLAAPVRDIERAREQFTKARDLQPEAMPPHFNLAETEFVNRKWADAEKGFAGLLTKFPKLPQGVRHLVIFKTLLCQVKQEKFADAEKLLADSFTFMDDTPAFYFAKSVICLQKKDEKTGNDWLTKAQVIFKSGDTSAYLDSLMESGYIDSLSVASPSGGDK